MRDKIIVFLLCITLVTYGISASQFAYPIGCLDEENLFVLYQQSVDDIELWIWNAKTKVAVKELSSMFTPSDVQLMPSGKGFSFIDRGRIRIKSFCKRMPRSIDILEPIDSILSVKWVTDDLCYFSGRYYGSFGIFLCNISKGLQPEISFLVHAQNKDVLYPCKLDNALYCLFKDNANRYVLAKGEWAPIELGEKNDFSQKFKALYVSDAPVCSLSIELDGRGILVECMSDVSSLDELLVFSCNVFDCDSVQVEKVFEFTLPAAYLLNGSHAQLRESINRFLPYYIKQDIYFSSYDTTTGQCNLYKYIKGRVEKVVCKKPLAQVQMFAPCSLRGDLFCGMILPGLNKRKLLEVDAKTGIMQFDLPTFL